MNKEAQERLNQILAKDPDTLNSDEIGFLRARQGYLKKAQLEEYNSILNPKTKPPVKETVKQNANTK